MIRTRFYVIALFMITQRSTAQVPLNLTVEHFTNTNCSICAGRNPGFYTNLNNQQNVVYISYHPSAPYAACKLSQQNKTDNDARTNHYGVYGSTPRIVINGNVISSSANYNSPSLFDSYKNLSSAFAINIQQNAFTGDSLRLEITIKRVATGPLNGTARLFATLVEDTIWYTGTNGETRHFQVSRKSLFGAQGISLKTPQTVGDSVKFIALSAWNPQWTKGRINTVAILQDSATKKTIQSSFSGTADNKAKTTEFDTDRIAIFPNPTAETFSLSGKIPAGNELFISDRQNKLVYHEKNHTGQPIAIVHLPSGVYSLVLRSNSRTICQKLIIQH